MPMPQVLCGLYSFFGVIWFAFFAGAVGDCVLNYLTAKELHAHLQMSPEERVIMFDRARRGPTY